MSEAYFTAETQRSRREQGEGMDELRSSPAALGDREERAMAESEQVLECRRLEAELAVAREGLEQARQEMRQFVSFLTHEISTPLTVIRGFSEMIGDEALSPEEAREYAADIQQEAARLCELIARTRAQQR